LNVPFTAYAPRSKSASSFHCCPLRWVRHSALSQVGAATPLPMAPYCGWPACWTRFLSTCLSPRLRLPCRIQASISFVAAIKTDVILSFLGLGVQDGVSWGLMLAESTQEVLAGHFNNFLAASIMLFLLLLGFNLLSDALQDSFDPKQAAL